MYTIATIIKNIATNPKTYSLTIPKGWEVIGTIHENNNIFGSALIKNQNTGIYCALSCNCIKSLDQDKVRLALPSTYQ